MFKRSALAALVLGAVALAEPAFASFHLMQIEQVIGGVNGDTSRQAIQLRMRFGGQNFVSVARVRAWDATGNKRQLVEVPTDAEVNRLIAVLIERMNLPRHSPDGQMMSYKFHHKSSGRQLLDSDTLASANVKEGDILRLQPEITAGIR